MDVSIRLSEYMKLNNILQKDIAELFKITPQAVSGILKGKSDLTTSQIVLIAERFIDLDLRWLLVGEGEMIPKRPYTLETDPLNIVSEPAIVSCPLCAIKNDQIKNLELHRDDLRKQISLLEFSLGKNVMKA